MSNKTATWIAAIAALVLASALRAHHSVSMFDLSTSRWVKGTVVRYAPVSPHTMIELEERAEGGEVQRWTIEGPFPGRLERILSANGMSRGAELVKPGDVIEVCGFYPKRTSATSENADGSPRRFVHGQALVMPDGRMQSWGPYGKLDNCVRPNDRPEAWVEFLNADALAQQLWCNARVFVGFQSTAPPGFVAEVDRQLAKPCRQP